MSSKKRNLARGTIPPKPQQYVFGLRDLRPAELARVAGVDEQTVLDDLAELGIGAGSDTIIEFRDVQRILGKYGIQAY